MEECKGLVFRGYSSVWYDCIKNRVEKKEGIRLLKRKSCKGCEFCGPILDQISEFIATDGLIFPEEGIEDGKLYTMAITNEHRDWESGQIDDWDLEIIKIDE